MSYNFQRTYSMTEAARELNIRRVGLQHLYYYLQEFNIIKPDRTPFAEYIKLGYFIIGQGTRNRYSQRMYQKTEVTEAGLAWLKKNLVKKIKELHEIYLREECNVK